MKKIIAIIIILVLVIPLTIVGGFIYYFEKPISKNVVNSDLSDDMEFTISVGDTSMDVSTNLAAKDITPNKYSYYYYARTRGTGTDIKTGEYVLKPSEMSLPEIAEIFEGGTIDENELTITIPEGYRSMQIEEILLDSALENMKKGELLQLVNYKGEEGANRTPDLQATYDNLESKYLFLSEQPDNQYKGLEGYLFPDTYNFHKDDSIEVIVDKMLDNFEKKLTDDLLSTIESQGKTLHEVMIMSTIVQRESGREYEENQKIAGVFYNRLDINMALGSCSTLQYLTNTNKFQYSYEDQQIESPYNTYQVSGLPPGPIANPGLDAIKATIDAEEHDYLYFLNDEDGGIHFGKTLDEHNENRRKYLD